MRIIVVLASVAVLVDGAGARDALALVGGVVLASVTVLVNGAGARDALVLVGGVVLASVTILVEGSSIPVANPKKYKIYSNIITINKLFIYKLQLNCLLFK